MTWESNLEYNNVWSRILDLNGSQCSAFYQDYTNKRYSNLTNLQCSNHVCHHYMTLSKKNEMAIFMKVDIFENPKYVYDFF